jgi:hypothetical protein
VSCILLVHGDCLSVRDERHNRIQSRGVRDIQTQNQGRTHHAPSPEVSARPFKSTARDAPNLYIVSMVNSEYGVIVSIRCIVSMVYSEYGVY